MTFTIREVLERLRELLEGEGGLADSLEQLRGEYGAEDRGWPIRTGILKAPPEFVEQAWGGRYPSVTVFCERVRSRPTERLRRFSGEVQAGIEVRVSQDRLEGITEKLHYYCDAVRDVLERRSGCIGPGLYLSGEATVQIDPVRKGGIHFLQSGRATCTVIVNRE